MIDPKTKETILKSPAERIWQKLGLRHRHGIDLTLSCLHTEQSTGIGEFLDLLPIIDWCHEIGFEVIQLLPLNDSGNDPSPYNALSSCALNPIFLSLHALPKLSTMPELKEKLHSLRELNKTPRVKYHYVLSHKLLWIEEYLDKVGNELINDKEYKIFIEKHHNWLKPYALFKIFKDHLSQNSWFSWPEELQRLSREEQTHYLKKYEHDVNRYYLVQFLCFNQLKQAKAHAEKKGVLLKGDIPILLSPDSCDVWHHPEFFDLKLAAGSPPDMFTPEGQNWGFPLFNWDALKTDGYSWWRQRLKVAAKFFDLYRIDHVIGFYRIWAIPHGRRGLEGCFIPRDESTWIEHGEQLLKMMIETTDMLPIAEDLGVVRPEIRESLHDLGICGTKVFRWERCWESDNHFYSIDEYDPIGMSTVSTHDSETVSLWWRDIPEQAEAYARFKKWEYKPILTDNQRLEILWDSHHSATLFHINLIQEYLALYPELIWTDPLEERINLPGTVNDHNWTYRTLPSVEQITAHEGLKKTIHALLSSKKPPQR